MSTDSITVDIVTTTNLEVAKDRVINITNKKKYTPKPSFNMIGVKTMSNPKTIDLLKEVANMSANEKICFFTIRNQIQWDTYDKRFIYQVPVNMQVLTPSEQIKFRKGFKLLEKKNLVKRISKGIYMINPYALIPTDFSHELDKWNSV